MVPEGNNITRLFAKSCNAKSMVPNKSDIKTLSRSILPKVQSNRCHLFGKFQRSGVPDVEACRSLGRTRPVFLQNVSKHSRNVHK